MGWLLIIFASPLLLVLTRGILGGKERVNLFVQRILMSVCIILVLSFLLSVWAAKNNYYIKGYRSYSFHFLLMVLSGIIYWSYDRGNLTKPPRFALFLCSLLSICMAAALTLEMTGNYKEQLYYNDRQYRLEEEDKVGLMRRCALPVLFVKKSIYERKYHAADWSLFCLRKSGVERIIIEPQTNGDILVNYFLKKEWLGRTRDSVNPQKVIYLKPR